MGTKLRVRKSVISGVAAIALVMTIVLPAAAAPELCAGTTSLGGGWVRISAPAWPTPVVPRANLPLTNVTRFAVDPTNADRILYTNGHALMLSKDGGCSWTAIFKLDPTSEFPYINGADKIIGMYIQGDTIYGHVTYAQHGTGSWVFYSHDLGASFQTATVGLPPAPGLMTWNRSLAVAPSDPQTLYFAVERNAGTGVMGASVSVNLDSVFASTDGGATWIERSLPTGRLTSLLEPISAQIHVDARDPDVVYAFHQDFATYRSTDGANNWAKLTTATPNGVRGNPELTTISSGTFTAILALPTGDGDNFILRSDDDGQSFYKIPTPGDASGVLFAGSASKVVVTTYEHRSSLWRIDTRSNRWVDISPPGSDSIFGEAAARAGTKTVVYAYNPFEIYRYSGRL
jgi:hypothetical protein